ncbi:MAG: patatin-like phospholipase family protein, partial [Luteibaculum sp.]
DIENKRAVILKDGDLNRAIRASSTYPFYVRATEYKDQLLFDGGLYNNFPVDVAIAEFNPKVLLGCNVSYNYEAPEIDDLLSQVKNMLVSKTDYTLQGMPGIIVEPENDITTFDFERFPEAIASGYETTLSRMDSIKVLINQQDSLQTASKRKAFNTRKVPYKIARLSFKKLNKNQESYLRKGIVKKQNQPYLADLRSNFLSLKEDPFIRYLYPDLKYNAADSNYTMDVDVDLEKSIVISFGGNVSNKAINTGFVSADWVHLGRFGTILSANTYFGKYYSSFKLDAKLYFEGKTPWVLNPYVVFNRWDYFKSRTSFFEDIQPAFVIENERFGGLSISLPENHSGKFVLDIRAFSNKPNYYLTRDFSNADTADQSLFQGGRIAFSWLQSTLDQKQYPSKGHKTSASISMVQGLESYIPGSTSEAPAFSNELKSWIQFRAAYQEFFEILPRLSTYPMAEIRLASFYTFSNFRSTKIFQPQYNPLTESPTLYLPRYRALNYGGLGLGFNYELSDRFSIRTQHHMFQPVNELEEGFRDQTTLGSLLADRFYIGSFAAVFQSPIGPLALNLNYYDKSSEPWSFMINFGYILFNNRSL